MEIRVSEGEKATWDSFSEERKMHLKLLADDFAAEYNLEEVRLMDLLTAESFGAI